jgi:methionine synthase I (cobalamin-dependent)
MFRHTLMVITKRFLRIRRNTSAEMQSQIKTYLDDNLVNIIGGCCGTTPQHIMIDC